VRPILRSVTARRTLTVLAGLTLGLSSFSAVLASKAAWATPLRVTNCNDDGSPGSLRSAVGAATSGSTITFTTSCPTITLVAFYIPITTNLTIKGPGAGKLAVSGNNDSAVFEVDSNITATISGLTIENGFGVFGVPHGSPSNGGGIFNSGTLTVKDSSVSNNAANGAGGGIFNRGTLTVKDSSISNNSAGQAGGGIYNACCAVTVANSTMSNNTAGGGGAIYNGGFTSSATLSVTRSTLSLNSAAQGEGGGIQNEAIATVRNSTFSGNSALYGGGIGNDLNMTTTNTTLSGNSATYGGAIYDFGTLTVRKGTFSGNSATHGGAIDIAVNGTVTIDHSAFSNNTDTGIDAYPGIYNSGGNLTVKKTTFS
jgi:predicted outer membrane repeat protein